MISKPAHTWGYPQTQWDEAMTEATVILRARARDNDTVTYSELTTKIRAIKFDYHSKPFDNFLGQIS